MKEVQSQPQAPSPAWKTGRLGAAEARLEAALDRLGSALDGCVRTLGTQAEDSGLMTGRITRLQEENAALRSTRDDVSGRLNAAIERLRRVLAH